MVDPDGTKVGPGNPPIEHRWVKGQPSPNPRGRPRKRDVKQMLASLDPYAEMVDRLGSKTVSSADGPVEIRESYLRKLVELAHDKKVSAKTRADILMHLTKLDHEALVTIEAEKEKQFNAALDYKERWGPLFRAAELAGRKPPRVLPHPDDVQIVGARVAIVGPKTQDEQDILEFYLTQRRTIRKLIEEEKSDEYDALKVKNVRSLLRMLADINKRLPPRLQETVPPMPPLRATD